MSADGHKRAYTTYAPHLRPAAKAHGFKGDPREFLQRCANTLAKAIRGDGAPPGGYKDLEAAATQFSAWKAEQSMMDGKAKHLFLRSRAFCDWLVGCVPAFESQHAEVLQDWAGPGGWVCLHFPTDAGLPSCLVGVGKRGRHKILKEGGEFEDMEFEDAVALVLTSPTADLHRMTATVPMTGETDDRLSGHAREVRCECGRPGCRSREVLHFLCRLVVGLGMYRSCFPEQFVEGVPPDLRHPSQHAYAEALTVGVAPAVCHGGTHDSPVAHYRSGCFKTLRAERWRNKRWQVVWCWETFVRGRAETALAPGEEAAA